MFSPPNFSSRRRAFLFLSISIPVFYVAHVIVDVFVVVGRVVVIVVNVDVVFISAGSLCSPASQI